MAKSTVIAPSTIPQEIQADIVALAVLRSELDRLTVACQHRQDKITAALLALVEVRP